MYYSESPIELIHKEINVITLPYWVFKRYGVEVFNRNGIFKCRCVVHGGQDDPNASMSLHNGKWFYRCWSRCDGRSLDVLDLVIKSGFAIDIAEAVEFLNTDLGLS